MASPIPSANKTQNASSLLSFNHAPNGTKTGGGLRILFCTCRLIISEGVAFFIFHIYSFVHPNERIHHDTPQDQTNPPQWQVRLAGRLSPLLRHDRRRCPQLRSSARQLARDCQRTS